MFGASEFANFSNKLKKKLNLDYDFIHKAVTSMKANEIGEKTFIVCASLHASV
jgi:hypothetical protein